MKMKNIVLPIIVLFLITSCVTKARYNEVLDNIKSLEKRHEKMEKQLEDLEKKNKILRDSIERGEGE